METFRKINLNAAETMANFKIIPVAVLNSVDQGLRIAELLTQYGSGYRRSQCRLPRNVYRRRHHP